MTINYKNLINGEKIFLREVSVDDVNENYCRWLNDQEINQFLETRHTKQTLSSIMDYVEQMLNKSDEFFWAICLKNTDRHIGNIKLGPINPYHKRAQLSLFIGEKTEWGKGIGTEAIKLVSDYGFNILGLNKIESGCYAVNKGSIQSFKKSGFKIEGEIPNHLQYKDKIISMICLGRFKTDI